MSMNKYMHPRNIYKNPPNFKKLAIEYPEFRQYLKQDISGKIILDFKDVNALRALSSTLLKKDFGLDVDIPANKLIPTIPLRLNYLLWIEDLLNIFKTEGRVYGIDIGTGASCVYPLIASKRFGWVMIGTEMDEDSISFAKTNVSRNLLDSHIKLLKVSNGAIFKEVLNESSQVFDFSMCNPPFFSSPQELHPFFKSRKNSRPIPKNAFCASINEVVTNGGEIDFIKKMIAESVEYKTNVKIFTTMVGHKSSLPVLKSKLRDVDVTSFKQTEFCQGHTTRWGLAWTFFDIDLRKIPDNFKSLKTKPPLYFKISDSDKGIEDLKNILDALWKALKFEVQIKELKKNSIIYSLIGVTNTWSNQRRLRREKMRLEQLKLKEHIEETSNKLEDMNLAASKRELDDDDEFYQSKKLKTDLPNNNILAELSVSLKKEKADYVIEFFENNLNTNRDTVHQIMQYVKNNLKNDQMEIA